MKPTIKLWKSMRAGLKSQNGDVKWKIGEWQNIKGEIEIYNNGFHASENIIDAMIYVPAEIIAEVEVRGKSIKGNDKQCWSDMRILRAWKWTKEDNVALAIYAAELVIDIYEKDYPNNKKSRKAIEAAKKYLKTGKTARAAEWAARAVWAVARAAGAAEWAAAWATWAEWAAAWATWAESAVAWATWAESAVAEVAIEATKEINVKELCHEFVIERLKGKKALVARDKYAKGDHKTKS